MILQTEILSETEKAYKIKWLHPRTDRANFSWVPKSIIEFGIGGDMEVPNWFYAKMDKNK